MRRKNEARLTKHFSLFGTKHLWSEKNKFEHHSNFGLGLLKTRTAAGGANFGRLQHIDSLGIVSHGFIAEPYHHMRLYNFYFIAGFPASANFLFNASFFVFNIAGCTK